MYIIFDRVEETFEREITNSDSFRRPTDLIQPRYTIHHEREREIETIKGCPFETLLR